MRNRWIIYPVIGFYFGVLDWYFLDLLAHLNHAQFSDDNLPAFVHTLIVVLIVSINYGIWLVPVIPAGIYEMKNSQNFSRAALVALLIWSTVIFSYITFYAIFFLMVCQTWNLCYSRTAMSQLRRSIY